MKQLSFMRKAMGLLLVPLAFTAIPASAYTLTVTKSSTDRNIYEGKDSQNNVFIFNHVGSNDCRFIGVKTNNTKVTIPESISYEKKSENVAGTETVTATVNKVDINVNEYADIEGATFSEDNKLQDIYLTDNIISVTYEVGVNYPLAVHFVTQTVPPSINMSTEYKIADYQDENQGLGRIAIYAPDENSLVAYKKAFDQDHFLVLLEGKKLKDGFEDEIFNNNGSIAKEDTSTGIYCGSWQGLTWSGRDKAGNTFGFSSLEPGRINDITCYGAVSDKEKITVPSYACITNPDKLAVVYYPVVKLNLAYYNDNETSFPGCSNLHDVYVPECIVSASWNGTGFSKISNFHFRSEIVPEMRFYERAEERVHIYVPDELFLTYAAELEDNYVQLWSETPASPVYVAVGEPGKLADAIAEVMKDLNQVRWLVITGSPNETDLRICRRLSRLEKLDLSKTTGLTSVSGLNDIKFLQEVILPAGLETIGESAFSNCQRLYSINIPDGVNTIEKEAFYRTVSLKTIKLPMSLQTIKERAFCQHEGISPNGICRGLESINLENVKTIGSEAFKGTFLTEVDLSSAEIIEGSAFSFSKFLTSVKFGDNVSEIGNEAFRYCDLTGVLEIPKKVISTGFNAFGDNQNIVKIIYHKDVVCPRASFLACRPKVVEAHMLFPTITHGFVNFGSNGYKEADLSETILYVPKLTINEYLYDDNWLIFKNIHPLEEDLTVLDINREFTLNKDEGIADKADLNMHGMTYSGNFSTRDEYGHLTVNRRTDLNLGTYSHHWILDYNTWNRKNNYGATLIPESKVTAEKIDLTLELVRRKWHFVSLPYDVNVKDIVADNDALWVIRKYSGKDRADMTGNTWQDMTANDVLKAGEGYIIYGDKEGEENLISYKFPPANNDNAFFAKDAVKKNLASYPSEFKHNASWNLVGNTYPAYLNLKGVEFDGPVSVWTGASYEAYSPADDDFVLAPFEAFFVQCQDVDGGDVITLNPEARAHSKEAAKEIVFEKADTRASRDDAKRSLFNFHINGENGGDRTRIVVNEAASMEYETSCDASKFMSIDESVPQIFVMNGNVRMAIDERPLSDGQFTLGSSFGTNGSYTISLDTRNTDGYSVTLVDNLTGISTDLLASPYTFSADTGTNENRFTVVIGLMSGVDSVDADGVKVNVEGNELTVIAEKAVEIMVAAADGKVVASTKSADFSATLEAGIYVVKVGNKVTKVNVGK